MLLKDYIVYLIWLPFGTLSILYRLAPGDSTLIGSSTSTPIVCITKQVGQNKILIS